MTEVIIMVGMMTLKMTGIMIVIQTTVIIQSLVLSKYVLKNHLEGNLWFFQSHEAAENDRHCIIVEPILMLVPSGYFRSAL